MTFKPIIDGKPVTELMNANWNAAYRSAGLTWINMLKDRALTMPADGGIFAEAYTSAGGRQGSVVTAESSAVFDTNKYKTFDLAGVGPYVVIEATSISALSDFTINNCKIVLTDKQGEWVLYCTTGTDAVKRAQIYKTLFYGTDGTNPRASSDYITGISRLRTSVTRDVGSFAYFATIQATHATNGTASYKYVGTFSSTTNNEAISLWSAHPVSGFGAAYNHFGTDRESVEKNNIENLSLRLSASQVSGSTTNYSNNLNAPDGTNIASSGFQSSPVKTSRIELVVLTKQTLSFAVTESSLSSQTSSNYNFTSSGFSAFESVSETPTPISVVTHTIPAGTFPADMSSSFVTFDSADFEDGASVEYKLTNATEDTGWLVPNTVATFTELTAKPDELIVKLIPKTTSPTAGYPSLRGVFLQGGKAL